MNVTVGRQKVEEFAGGKQALRSSDNLRVIPSVRNRAVNQALDGDNWVHISQAAAAAVERAKKVQGE